ncbi:acyl-CoA thioesterase [Curvivirga aplysinae]|uniref:acyl-CoA thioesterase n=1 Tax=Curvivirga aplysinae TaxID=2529852 RepID=UPI0012BBCBF4|nr:thioesterase family protein [Curvivirga aplysinae]MTI11052.1 acyl-CoA thioesterase [Curvivirga aplysinae]
MSFTYPQKVLFKHCDPAGIVFYPRYFEMINDCVETFFDEVLVAPFSEIHPDSGVPTAEISTRFLAPSRLGDDLKLTLEVIKIGGSSMRLSIRASCDQEVRFEASSTLVFVNEKGKPQKWPETIRAKIHLFMEDGENEE